MRFLRDLRPTIIDRYVLMEMVAPVGLGLLLFTFILLLQQITVLMGALIARSATPSTILRVLVYLLPSMLAINIPMAFLLGVLLAFGRLGSESELIALRASGVSPLRLLRPVAVGALLTGGATFWIMADALPAANQAYRQLMFSLVINKTRTSIKPRVFTDDLLPDRTMTIYATDIASDTSEWEDVFIHDGRDAKNPRVILAHTGHLVVDEAARNIELHMEHGSLHTIEPGRPEAYTVQRFRTLDLPLPFEDFYPQVTLSKGSREMTLKELEGKMREVAPHGRLATAPYEVEWHKKFAIPAACLVFGLLGLGLSLGSRKEAKSAAFGLSIVVISVYYVFIKLGEHLGDSGLAAPWVAIWAANIVLGALGITLLVMNQRSAAFDPLDPNHYTAWIPRFKRAARPARKVEAPPQKKRPQATMVVRVPKLSFGFPSLLDRYIAWQFVGHLVLVTAALWSIFIIFDFSDLFYDMQQYKVPARVVFHYYAFYTPMVIHLMVPVAVLMATLTTFGLLSRRNEITAMKAGGISIYRIVVPVIALGAVVALGLFGMGEYLLPQTNLVADQDHNLIKGRPARSSSYLARRWMLGSDGRIYNYEYALPGSGPSGVSLFGLSVFDVEKKDWELKDRSYASRAEWQPNRSLYDLQRGWRRRFGPRAGFEVYSERLTHDLEPPSYFQQEERGPETFAFFELKQHISKLESLGLDVVRLRVQLHRKPAFPTVAIVVTVLAIPFSFVVGRRGALYGIGLSIMITILYYCCLAAFEALGNNALLPPALAAWAPNLLFGAAGLYLMLTLDT